jgi:hypothetical protein
MRRPKPKSDAELRARLSDLSIDELKRLPALRNAELRDRDEPMAVWLKELDSWLDRLVSRRGPRGVLSRVDLFSGEPVRLPPGADGRRKATLVRQDNLLVIHQWYRQALKEAASKAEARRLVLDELRQHRVELTERQLLSILRDPPEPIPPMPTLRK